MSTRIIPFYTPTVYLETACNTCSDCLYWEQSNRALVTAGGRTLEMAQCLCAGRDDAPYAEVQGPFEAVVMTHAECWCRAFEVHPDAAADAAAEFDHYTALNRRFAVEALM